MTEGWPLTRQSLKLLRERFDLPPDDGYVRFCDAYRRVCSTWNLAAKLLSRSDLEVRFDEHIADSLSLYPYLRPMADDEANYVDVGSGGGFPALPLLAAGGLSASALIERSATKADFLRQAIRNLGIARAEVLCMEFDPRYVPPSPRVFTARAIEQPGAIDEQILETMSEGDLYVAQRAVPSERPGMASVPLFDEFDRQGLRRGRLYLVSDPEIVRRFHVEPRCSEG